MKIIKIKTYITLLIMLICGFMMTGCEEEAVGVMADMSEELSYVEELAGALQANTDAYSEAELTGPYAVKRVVDGDTVILIIDGNEERVRLIGVNTPESVHPDENKNVAYGKIASEYTKKALEGQNVYLELDVQERDKYGRILGYVYYNNEMYNERLVLDGHAEVATYPPNVKYVEVFEQAQKEARKNNVGMWAYVSESDEMDEKVDSKKENKKETSNVTTKTDYVGNSNSKKFHKSNCSSVEDMSAENSVGFKTRDEAIEKGYEPCGRCKP